MRIRKTEMMASIAAWGLTLACRCRCQANGYHRPVYVETPEESETHCKSVSEPFRLRNRLLVLDAKRHACMAEPAGESLSLRDGQLSQSEPLAKPAPAKP